MICKSCTFETQRTLAKEWHAMCRQYPDELQLHAIIPSILTTRVTEYLPDHWQGHFSGDRLGPWIRERDQEGTVLLVVETGSRTPIGFLTLFESVEDELSGNVIRLGYVISEPFWGRGIATELVRGFIDWSKENRVSKIVSGVDPKNPGSIKVLEKCGFARLPQNPTGEPEIQYYERLVPRSDKEQIL